MTEAARRVHGDAIGVGGTFHLFRLPEILEQELRWTMTASHYRSAFAAGVLGFSYFAG